MKLLVKDVLRATRGCLVSGYPRTLCGRLSIDSRTLTPGDLFFALRGPHFDGHHFLRTAAQKKAQVAVISRLDPKLDFEPWAAPDLIQVSDTLVALQDVARYVRTNAVKTKFIGLSGSNGKTTTKEMLASILRLAGPTLSTRGNLNNHIGVPLTLAELEEKHEYALLEMGTSHKGDMDLLVDLVRPHIGLITNVGKDHLEFLGTPEGVLEVNRKLYDALPKDGVAIINLEDPLLRGLVGKLHCKTLTYGRQPDAEVRAVDIVASAMPLRFTLAIGKDKIPVTLHTFGEVQVLNAMAAAATAHALGIPLAVIAKGLETFEPAAMRMQVQTRSDGTHLVNDAYNANPSSMRASIESVCRSYSDRPRWLVLGDMRELGSIAREEHIELGRWIAGQRVDRVFLYGRDTRFILQGLTDGKYRGVAERHSKKKRLAKALELALKSGTKPVILFKASRSLRLEQVTRAL